MIPRLIHVSGVSRDTKTAQIYARMGHLLRRFWRLRSKIDFESTTYSIFLALPLIRAQYDVVLNFAGPVAGRLCVWKRRWDGTPFINAGQGQATGWLALQLADQHPDSYVALTGPSLKWIRANRPELDARLIPNGVDSKTFRPNILDPGLDMPAPIILTVSALTPMKRIDLAIKAVGQLDQGSLLLIGDGESRDDYSQLGLNILGPERFRMLPAQTHRELPSYYAACDVFTLPSPGEPFGIVFLEAMSSGLPVVAHHGEDQRWIIGEYGITCNCLDPKEYASALRIAASRSATFDPRARAKDFDWTKISSQYAQLLDDLVMRESASARHL